MTRTNWLSKHKADQGVRNIKVAAIQINADFANVQYNLNNAETWIRKSVGDGAELVLLPEFFTTAIGFSDKMFDAVSENRRVREQMVQWAHDFDITLGGSFIEFDGENAYNVFLLCFSDESTFEHKKDIPTQFENCYYTNGDTVNILETPIGNIGIALCWEMIRYDTVRRIIGNVDIVLAGSCWWDLPDDASPERQPLREYNQKLAAETPARFAELLQVPVIHANHCGKVTALNFPKADSLQKRQLVGAAQIVSGQGETLVSRGFCEDEGFVCAELEWDSNNRKKVICPQGYWIPDLPESYLNAWNTLNPLGVQYYKDTAIQRYKTVR